MNEPHDMDRELSAWLGDGPSRSPERPIDAALAHAQAHPRRRDPFASFRKDPMSSQQSAAIVRPLPLLAVLGILLAAAFVAASAGGLFQQRPAVVPPPIATASPSAPSAVPTPSPAATAGIGSLHVDLIENVGADASIDITDLSGTLVNAVSGHPADGASVPDGAVEAAAPVGRPTVVVLTWSGSPCDTTHTMTIAADGATILIERPACSGDAIGVDHVLELTFDHPIDLKKISPTIATTGG